MSAPTYGRVQTPEPPSLLRCLHIPDANTTLRVVDHEPKVAVLDQSDLLAQGIRVSSLVPGAQDVDALGSCTANANTSALSNVLPESRFLSLIGAVSCADAVAAEKWAIRFYHACTDQTGNPAEEWPPEDCGSSGVYVVQENEALSLCSGAEIAHGAQSIVSCLQKGGLLMGSPFFYSWEEPDAHGFVDGQGTTADLRRAIASGVAGGHETYISAIEKLVLHTGNIVDPHKTILRVRNSWSKAWGVAGSFRIHLSTLCLLSHYCDFRRLV